VVGLTERVADFQTFRMSDWELVDLTGAIWNHTREWLRRVDGLRRGSLQMVEG
jgi:hypothetical protein